MILVEEHYIFRGGSFSNYSLDSYNDMTQLPLGLGALGATLFGAAGAVLGMGQVIYVGPLAGLISEPYGGDIGFELSCAFSAMYVHPSLCAS